MDGGLLELRNRTYAAFVELGRAPAAGELGDEEQIRAGWRALHEAHALVLNPATDEIRMANPFSAVPTGRLTPAPHAVGAAATQSPSPQVARVRLPDDIDRLFGVR